MQGELITSAANPVIRRVRQLGERKHRRREGAFVVRGVQPVWQAVEAGAQVEVLLVAPDLLQGEAGERIAAMVAGQEAQGVRAVRLSAELFGRIDDRDSPAGLAAIVRRQIGGLDTLDLPVSPDAVFIALHEIGNPGNLGTIIRTADATGAAGVVLAGASADPFDPGAVKASMGALFSVPVAAAPTAAQFFDWCRAGGVAVAVTSAKGGESLWEAQLQLPLAFLLGSEGSGLPGDLLAAGDLRLRIPMTGTAESLNLAVAAGVLLYEARRRRSQGK